MFITLEKENEVALQRAEMRMVSWMCGVKVKDRFPSKELRERLGIDDMTLVLQQNRLRWYDHVLRKDDDWVKKSTKHPPLVATYVDASHAHTHTKTRLTALCPRLPVWPGTRKVKPIWILLKQETVSGSGTSWAICKSAPRSRQITTPAPHHSVFYRPDALPVAQSTA